MSNIYQLAQKLFYLPNKCLRFRGFLGKATCREIQAHLLEIYGVEVSPDLISTVTDSVIDEVRAWQSRPLDPVYPILYLDALQVKVKDQGRVSNKAIYLLLASICKASKKFSASGRRKMKARNSGSPSSRS